MLKLYFVNVKIIGDIKILTLSYLQLLLPQSFICSDNKDHQIIIQSGQGKMFLKKEFVVGWIVSFQPTQLPPYMLKFLLSLLTLKMWLYLEIRSLKR